MFARRFLSVITSLSGPILLLLVLLCTIFYAASPAEIHAQTSVPSDLMSKVQDTGRVRVIVRLDIPYRGEASLDGPVADVQQQTIAAAQEGIQARLAPASAAVTAVFQTIPFLGLEVDAAALEQLTSMAEVLSIQEDVPIPAALSSSIPVIGADQAWAAGYTGAGQTIAILDTGVDLDHPAFTTGGNRIVSEACYSSTYSGYGSVSVCPGGVAEATGTGTGRDCVAAATGYSAAESGCTHGTHVAGIAAGRDGVIQGVAPDATIIAIQVFSLFINSPYCGGSGSCVLTYTSDQVKALERVFALRSDFDIAAVNMSLGGGQSSGFCDSDARKAVIDNLAAAGIATIIAAGNDYYKSAVSAPGCISTAITVGSTNDVDIVSSFSNIGPQIDLLAPGEAIYSSVPNDTYGSKNGTSMATPMVAGAWALYQQLLPSSSVTDTLEALQNSATPVDDTRNGGVEVGMHRINIDQALNSYESGLSIKVSANTDFALPSEKITVTFDIGNSSNVTATNAIISATLPADLSLEPLSLSGDGLFEGGIVTWTTGITLTPGQMIQREFTARINPSTSGVITLTGSASATGISTVRQAQTSLTINQVAACNFQDGFEDGELGLSWEAAVTADGRVAVNSALPSSGSYALLLDDQVDGGAYSEAAAILHLDNTNQDAVNLSFDWYDLGDEYNAAYDGVFIRDQENAPWVKIFDFDGSNHHAYQNADIDLLQAVAQNGLQTSRTFQIKFSFFDNFAFNAANIGGGDGYLIDRVAVNCLDRALAGNLAKKGEAIKPGDVVTYTLAISNTAPMTATGVTVSTTLPAGIALAGPVIANGGGGETAADSSNSPVLWQNGIVGPQSVVTLTIPLSVDLNIQTNVPLTWTSEISSSDFLEPIQVSDVIWVEAGSEPYRIFIPYVLRPQPDD